MFKKLLTTLFLLVVFLAAGSIAMSCASRRAPELGFSEEAGRLTPCPETPNCVCSQDTDEAHGIAPLRFEGEPADAFARLTRIVEELPRTTVVERDEGYLRAEVRTTLLRFIDDVEFLLSAEDGVIHVRSASRVGHSDLGVNRKRIEALRERWRGSDG